MPHLPRVPVRAGSLLLFALAAALLPRTGHAGAEPRARALESALSAYRQAHGVPGLALALRRDGREVLARGAGLANVEAGTPATPDTWFRNASTSKAITAVLTMELVRDGRLKLEDTARTHLPDLPPAHTYTVRDLLCHQAGIRHYLPPPAPDPTHVSNRRFATCREALSLFLGPELLSEPGTRYHYSTHGYTVLGAVLEAVTARPYERYASERLAAWGIRHGIRPEDPGRRDPARAQVYRRQDGESRPAPRDDLSWKTPGGGFESTPRAMASLGERILQGKVLPPDFLDRMWTAQRTRTGPTNYGLGWQIVGLDGRRGAAHGGSQLGSRCAWLLLPEERLSVCVMSNQSDHPVERLAQYAARLELTPPGSPLPDFKPN